LATLNVEAARAAYGIQRNALLPTINATGAQVKGRASADLTPPLTPRVSDTYKVDLGAVAWEIDLFGRIRSLKDKALEEYLATEQARRGAQILLVSAVANAYLTEAADREGLALTERTLQANKTAYDLVERQSKAGVATELDLRRAQTLVDSARRDVARYAQLVAQDENALNLLVGAPLPSELRPSKLTEVKPPREVSPGLSSEVLLERPDVLQAEGLLKAANANIGAARASLFPRISLTASVGRASTELSGLFTGGTDTWSYSPQIMVPIFDTRAWSALKVTKVQREIAVAQYEKTIQSAFRDVADALALRGTISQQVSAQQSLVDAATETARLSNARYAKGVDDYLGVLDAQRSLYGAQQALVNLQLVQLASHIRLYSALGGGWR